MSITAFYQREINSNKTVLDRKRRLWIGYFVPMITHNGRNMFSDGLMQKADKKLPLISKGKDMNGQIHYGKTS